MDDGDLQDIQDVLNACDGSSLPSFGLKSIGKVLSTYGPYVVLLLRSRGDALSVASATVLFLQASGVNVPLAEAVEYVRACPVTKSVTAHAGEVSLFTAAIQLMSDVILGTERASVARASPIWSAAMKVAHWLFLGPLHFLLGTRDVTTTSDWYSHVFPDGMSPVGLSASFAVLAKAFWSHGIAVLRGTSSLAEIFAQDEVLTWFQDSAEALANASNTEWLVEKGFIAGESQALTVEYEQYIGQLIRRGQSLVAVLHARAAPLVSKALDTDKALRSLQLRVRSLRLGVENKEQPVCILIYSVPNCKKSSFQLLLLRMVWDVLYPTEAFDPSAVAAVNVSAARLDNVTGQTRILTIDDAGMYFLEYQKNPLGTNPMAYVNSVPTMLDQAEISRKGTEMMNHKAVLINANTRTIQIPQLNVVPAAAFRRIWRVLVIAPKNKAEVIGGEPNRLLTPAELNEAYDFTVERYSCRDDGIFVVNDFTGRDVTRIGRGADSERIDIKPNERHSFAECVFHLKRGLAEYITLQRNVKLDKDTYLRQPMCRACGNLSAICVCDPPPADTPTGDDLGGGDEPTGAQSGFASLPLTWFASPPRETQSNPLATAAGVVALLGMVGSAWLGRKAVRAVSAYATLALETTERVVGTYTTLAREATEAVHEVSTSATTTLDEVKAFFQELRRTAREKAVKAMGAAALVTVSITLCGIALFSVGRIYRSLVPQSSALELVQNIGAVPGVVTVDWPKGKHTPYVVPPPTSNHLMGVVPRNKVLADEVLIQRALVRLMVVVADGGQARTMYGLIVESGKVLTVWHPFADLNGEYAMFIVGARNGGLVQDRSLSVRVDKDVTRVPGKDYAVVAIGTNYAQSILRLFPTKLDDAASARGTAWRFDPNDRSPASLESHFSYLKRENACGIASSGFRYTAVAPYGPGTCGTVLYSQSSGQTWIYGLHSLGQDSGDYGWAEAITRSEVDNAINAVVANSGFHAIGRHANLIGGFPHESLGLDHPHSKTIFTHVTGYGEYVGNVRAFRVSDTASQFTRTPLFSRIVGEKGMALDLPLTKAETLEDGTYYDPLLRAAVANSTPPGIFNQELLERCFDNYMVPLRALPWENAGYLSLHQAVNGEMGDISSLNFSAAAGIMIGGKKRDHVTGEPGNYEVDDEVARHIDALLRAWREGKQANLIYRMSIKDEPRKPGKPARIFSASNFAETVVTRMHFGGFFEFLKKYRGETEHAVGINCTNSVEWSAVVEKLGGLDASCIALDASNFDVANQLAPYVLIMVARFLRDQYPNHPWSQTVVPLAREHLTYLRSYRGEVLAQTANQPSGTSFTAEINSVCTSVYERVYYYALARTMHDYPSWEDTFRAHDFNKDMAMLNYGDDFVMSRRREVLWYSLEGRNKVATMLGMAYSMPDKESALRELPLREVDFLKRGFRKDGDLMCAPLDIVSIYKSLAFYRRSSLLLPRQAMAEAAKNAVAQLYMHGSDVFHREVEYLRQLLESLSNHPDYGNVVEDVFPLSQHKLTYEELYVAHSGGTYNEMSSGV